MSSNMNILIRPATDQDSSAVLNLLLDIWINEYGFDVKREDLPDLHHIEGSYILSGGMFIVATHEGSVIGTIACEKLDELTFVLKRMFLHKDYRGKGIAQALLDQLIAHVVHDTDQVTFYLSTKEDLAHAAKHFYLRNGFEVISKDQVPEGFPFFYEDDLYMRRQF